MTPLAFFAATVSGQTSGERPRNTFHRDVSVTAPANAPVVHLDRTITFTVRAPAASKVELLVVSTGQKPMTRDADGVWTITIGPLEPEIYLYNFVVDGLSVVDMSNSAIKVGRSMDRSIVEVPGSPARFDEAQSVPHGTLQIREYISDVVKLRRRVFVYLPPQYDREPARRFAVLYLRLGVGDL
jgi:enterochelin esterase family protein